MTKSELENLFKKLEITYNEGIQYMEKNDSYPRIVYFEYLWEDILASGKKYDGIVHYQVSFRSLEPRDPKLIELKKLLNDSNIHPRISIEYIKDKREWHSYFAVEVIEDVCSSL